MRVAKKFRILATDRMVARLSLFMDTELTGMSDEQIAEFVRTHGTAIPSQGHRFIHSEGVKNTFLSATLEAGDINATIQTQTIGIVGALGHPISWYGYGDGSTRATAETQQTPAAMDMKRFKGQIIEALQTLLYYVADAAILSRYVSSDPSVTPLTEIDVKDADGNPARRIMRECIAITVSTIPSAPQQAKSLAVTKDAVAVIASDDSGAELSGKRMLTDDKRRALMNWALAADGVGIEVEAFEEAAKAEEDPYAV